MTAIAWTLVGLMAGSLGVLASALFTGIAGFGRLDARIDGLGSSLTERIDGLGSSLTERIDGLGARIDAQGLELRADIRDVREAIATLDQRLTRAGG